jgi:enhancing lycopene biosynthesis protein 2
MSRRIGVLLSGCGVYDGTEIHEAVLTLLALDRRDAKVVMCAPDMPQAGVVDHLSGEPAPGEGRNVLVESARIARGHVRNVARLRADEIDGLVLPGGFGAARNLCDFARQGGECTAHPDVARLVREVHEQGKPIAALCIAPVVVARVLGGEGPVLTIGDDPATAAALESMGATHSRCPASDVVVDRRLRLVTTPAYMLARSISEVADGIERAMTELLALAAEGPLLAEMAAGSLWRSDPK